MLRELAEVETDEFEMDELEEAEDEIAEALNEVDAVDPLDADFAYDTNEDATDDLSPAAAKDEDDLSRLMEAADTKMDEPETSSRRQTYSQLRGAVAVANAEQAAGGTIETSTDDDAYRKDLASAVRPRRPSAVTKDTSAERTRRPTTEKPAPLKLVAEQRVDDLAGQARRGPVRPRRVSTVQVDETVLGDTSTDGFAQFAQEMDAHDLPDLLEAAAAYMSFVEGRAAVLAPSVDDQSAPDRNQ